MPRTSGISKKLASNSSPNEEFGRETRYPHIVVAVETLAIAIRQNSDIKGIYIEEQETKLLQHADDTTAILADTNSAKVLFELLDRFRNISGLKINCSKTEGMWIGSLKESKEECFGIKWPKILIKALGVYFTYDQNLLKEKNFIERLDSIKKSH